MSVLPTHLPDIGKLLNIIQSSSRVRSHKDLVEWLHSDIRDCLSNDILFVARGDFKLRRIQVDIVSFLPGIHTAKTGQEDFQPFLTALFERWENDGRKPFNLTSHVHALLSRTCIRDATLQAALKKMGSAMIHGIKDKSGRQDCLYVALSINPSIDERTARNFKLLVPYLNSTLLQVAYLRDRFPAILNIETREIEGLIDDELARGLAHTYGLTQREEEIMRWVSMAKSDTEIGVILKISPSAVKDHLRCIFSKLGATNKAHAILQPDRDTAT